MLARIRDTLKTLKTASAGQLAAELAEDRESVEAALAYWRNRGRVRALPLLASGSAACGGCISCAPAPGVYSAALNPGSGGLGVAYEWVDLPPVEA